MQVSTKVYMGEEGSKRFMKNICRSKGGSCKYLQKSTWGRRVQKVQKLVYVVCYHYLQLQLCSTAIPNISYSAWWKKGGLHILGRCTLRKQQCPPKNKARNSWIIKTYHASPNNWGCGWLLLLHCECVTKVPMGLRSSLFLECARKNLL